MIKKFYIRVGVLNAETNEVVALDFVAPPRLGRAVYWMPSKVDAIEFSTREEAEVAMAELPAEAKGHEGYGSHLMFEYNIVEASYGYANEFGYSDVRPFEIVKVVSDKTIEVREMSAKSLPWDRDFHPGGFFGHTSNQNEQKWDIKSNEEGHTFRIRKGKNGWKSAHGSKFIIAEEPRKFYDFNF
jgi:hypothetical protein